MADLHYKLQLLSEAFLSEEASSYSDVYEGEHGTEMVVCTEICLPRVGYD
jgi:hypothetical protein